MATPMIVLGVLLYAASGFLIAQGPTSVQEITGILIATNGTLFLVGGIIGAALGKDGEA